MNSKTHFLLETATWHLPPSKEYSDVVRPFFAWKVNHFRSFAILRHVNWNAPELIAFHGAL